MHEIKANKLKVLHVHVCMGRGWYGRVSVVTIL